MPEEGNWLIKIFSFLIFIHPHKITETSTPHSSVPQIHMNYMQTNSAWFSLHANYFCLGDGYKFFISYK